LIDACHHHGAHILSMTLPESYVPIGSTFDKQRQEFNRLIREELCERNKEKTIVVLDVDRDLPQYSLNDHQRAEIWDDGVHLTPSGYDRLGDLIYQALKTYF
jgi:lysophospholipase L1-like esterase